MPANEKEMKLAALLYYHTFEEELPDRNYRKQDIDYIIQQLIMNPEKDVFDSYFLH